MGWPASPVRSDRLFVVTFGYVLVPNVIFALGWLRPGWAVPVVAAVVACALDVWRRSTTASPALSPRAWILVLAFAAFWAFAAGIGELNFQTTDYLKHNVLFHDLVVERWPVVYRNPGPDGPILCYYIAYYLPASLLGKMLGLKHVAAFSLGWALLGIGLAFAWVFRFGQPRGAIVLGAFTLIDGFCWLPGLPTLAQKLGLLGGAVDPEWWHTDRFVEHFWSFGASHTRLLFPSEPGALVWAPQQTLGAWLATACVLRTLLEDHPARHVVVVNAAVLLWSPLVGVGLVPFTAAACLRRPRSGFSWPNALGGAAVATPVGLYFQGHYPQQFFGLLMTGFSGVTDWLKYLLFLLLAVGVLWAPAWLIRRTYGVPALASWRILCLASLTLVIITPVFLGNYNDWVMRVSSPSLFVLHLTLANTAVGLWNTVAPLKHRLAFILLLLLSAERSLKVYALAPFGRLGGQGIDTTIVTARRYAETIATLPGTRDFDFAGQYLGRPDSFFGRHLLKRAGRASEHP